MKLLDYEERRGELERSANPFALIVLAHLDAQKARKLPDERSKLEAKLGILRRLYDRRLGGDNIRDLVRFIDGRRQGMQEGLREGQEQGLREALGLLLETRFGPAGIALQPRLLEIQELDRLRTLLAALGRAERIEEFEEQLGKS